MRSDRQPLYMIGVASRLCGVHPQTLRQYEVAGVCGVGMLVMARGMSYAVEARPYGLVLGVYGLVLLAWQGTGEGERGRKWAVGALSLLAMVLGGLHRTQTTVARRLHFEVVALEDDDRPSIPCS